MKLVLAAAMWNNPHMLVLDEPTNYLDRDSLGALASAIMEFQGCVVMISHNSGAPPHAHGHALYGVAHLHGDAALLRDGSRRKLRPFVRLRGGRVPLRRITQSHAVPPCAEFTSALCNETWFVEAGRCAVSGGALVPTVGDNGRISPSPSSLNLASKAGSMASGASTASLISLDQVRGVEDPLHACCFHVPADMLCVFTPHPREACCMAQLHQRSMPSRAIGRYGYMWAQCTAAWLLEVIRPCCHVQGDMQQDARVGMSGCACMRMRRSQTQTMQG